MQQFLITLYTLFSVLPCLIAGLALPDTATSTPTRFRSTSDEGLLFRRDDEWTMVLYNENKSGGQCGGTSRKVTGNSDSCIDVKDSKCVDLKVGYSIASVIFNWKRDSCSGDRVQYNVVQGGTDSNGVDLNDQVFFVQITGNDGGRKEEVEG